MRITPYFSRRISIALSSSSFNSSNRLSILLRAITALVDCSNLAYYFSLKVTQGKFLFICELIVTTTSSKKFKRTLAAALFITLSWSRMSLRKSSFLRSITNVWSVRRNGLCYIVELNYIVQN